jgi:Na+/H+ antiporter NhaD/arsenite permease-like protein
MKKPLLGVCAGLIAALPLPAAAATAGPTAFGIPLEFILFALTLLGVALYHHRTLEVALTGLAVISLYKIGFTGFHEGNGLSGWLAHLGHEWVVLANLLGLLLGFALLARHFEDSGVPRVLPRFLPDDWKGAFVLLVMVFVLSSFLDNIAAALIGGTVAAHVFRRRVHIGYLAAIVAASNAGGSGSVVGDTTTTMMWIAGVAPLDVTHAYVAATVALLVSGLIAARQQHAWQPIQKDASVGAQVDWMRVGIVLWILAAAIATNLLLNTHFPEISDSFPFLGAAVWVAILLAAPVRKTEWSLLPDATKGSIFLLSLVVCASMMPVEELPPASWHTSLGLGFVSAVFDNIPLTALGLVQGGYDWGVLAYAVGFGGSMIWFGSSAGVALSNLFPEARSVGAWLKNGWHVALAYVVGFFVMLAVVGWHPHPPHKIRHHASTPAVQVGHVS